jgi:membrane-bound inhibitor of C-type lysozyme
MINYNSDLDLANGSVIFLSFWLAAAKRKYSSGKIVFCRKGDTGSLKLIRTVYLGACRTYQL